MKKHNAVVPSADEINEAHRLARESAETAIQYAIRCGKLLAAKKAELPRGTFDAWVAKYCSFGRATAFNYMKAAKSSNALDGYTSLRQALSLEAPRKSPVEPPAGAARKSAKPDDPFAEDDHKPAVAPAKPVPAIAAAAPAPSNADAPDWTEDDEAAANEAAELDERQRIAAAMAADDKLAEAFEQIRRLTAEVAQLKLARDGYMRGKAEALKLVKAKDRIIAKLEARLKAMEQGKAA